MIVDLLSGALSAFGLVAALLLLRAYRRTRDALFAYFAIAFVILSADQIFLAFTRRFDGEDPFGYLPRIVAFGIILIAIVERNRR